MRNYEDFIKNNHVRSKMEIINAYMMKKTGRKYIFCLNFDSDIVELMTQYNIPFVDIVDWYNNGSFFVKLVNVYDCGGDCDTVDVTNEFDKKWIDIKFDMAKCGMPYEEYFNVDKYFDECSHNEIKERIFKFMAIPLDEEFELEVKDENDNYILYGLNGAVIMYNKDTDELFFEETIGREIDSLDEAEGMVFKNEKEQFNAFNNNEMKDIPNIAIKRIEYLIKSQIEYEDGDLPFSEGATFVWLKGHTMCLRSALDTKNFYIAKYKTREDVVPKMVSRTFYLKVK